MPDSTTVVQQTVNLLVVGSNPTRAAWEAGVLGGLLKRSTRSDCKSDGIAFVGSNPTSTIN